MNDFLSVLNDYSSLINALLEDSVPPLDYSETVVRDAMKYSLNIGGKRIRPILTLEFCKVCGGDIFDAVNAAKAIEMIHTYSLIHDDLPCMDNDDMRRGMPSCHVKFGESFALLAGDGLLTEAFQELSGSRFAEKYPERALKCVSILSEKAGLLGMIGGQTIDLSSENKTIDAGTLRNMHRLKTGALIKAACQMGVICAGGSDEQFSAASLYADNIGQAFQIVDDILDETSTEETLGKPVGSDKENHKSTYVSLFGLEKAKEMAREHTDKAILALSVFGGKAEFLASLALYLSDRKY